MKKLSALVFFAFLYTNATCIVVFLLRLDYKYDHRVDLAPCSNDFIYVYSIVVRAYIFIVICCHNNFIVYNCVDNYHHTLSLK